jgi:hypothetical protein
MAKVDESHVCEDRRTFGCWASSCRDAVMPEIGRFYLNEDFGTFGLLYCKLH